MSQRGISAIVFDLDGTLVDSLPGIEASVRAALAETLADRAVPDVRSAIGPPAGIMLRRLFPELDEVQLEDLARSFRAHYDNEGCLQAELYPGVEATLRLLAEKGIEQFVLTNKRLRPTLRILEARGIRRYFRTVISPDMTTPPLPAKKDGALKLQREYALAPERSLVVGDGVDDAEAAAACGFGFVVAAYGYGNVLARTELRPFAVVNFFTEVAALVL